MTKSYYKINKTMVQKHELICHRLYGTWDQNKLSDLQMGRMVQQGCMGQGTAIWLEVAILVYKA